jgi:hypothetical protein
MESIDSIMDSVETSVTLKLFSSLKTASYAHIFNNKFEMFPISQCKEMDNFNPDRLSQNAYPKNDRPRGQTDLRSVLHHRKIIKKDGYPEPIWIALKKGKYILLDGAHRIVASYLEGKRVIPAFIVKI